MLGKVFHFNHQQIRRRAFHVHTVFKQEPQLSRKDKRRLIAKEQESKYQIVVDEKALKGYIPVIGLEVHAQITTNSKLFSGSSTKFNIQRPNDHVSLMDVAAPGTLPVINKACVEQAIKTSLALSGQVQLVSQFDRKHYFYPDLPHAYQITQQFKPIMRDGHLLILIGQDQYKPIRIQRLQIEMDSGKSIHEHDHINSLIDLNRAGIALMEIVSHPDIANSSEAASYLKKLQYLLRHLGTCDGNMEEGSLRCDVNISVHKPGQPYGTRCEVKNLASIVSVSKTIDYEILRQIELIESGGNVLQETRLFDQKLNKTIVLRSKEDAPDYRFFPEPDLPPLVVKQEFIDQLKSCLPESPDEIVKRLQNKYNLQAEDAQLVLHMDAVDLFENTMSQPGDDNRNAKSVVNWITSELMGLLNKDGLSFAESPLSVQQIASLVDAVGSEQVSGRIGKQITQIMYDESMQQDKKQRLALQIADEKGWKQINDVQYLSDICEKVVQEGQEQVKKVHANRRVLGSLIGKVMEITGGMANPEKVTKIMQEKCGLQ
ncbi:aspartyl-tRNA amidotransferase subunit B [Acrasis kona]|uniref:Glutamyl-tRNA(Gln) amidotransferase subunit B, mitochondrial n=1 Tax=Acrasis kona TaxID=1008807 RepID=A0AAW2ZIR5_9EUKA